MTIPPPGYQIVELDRVPDDLFCVEATHPSIVRGLEEGRFSRSLFNGYCLTGFSMRKEHGHRNIAVLVNKSNFYKITCKLAGMLSLLLCLVSPAKETRKRVWVIDTVINYAHAPWLLPYQCKEQFPLYDASQDPEFNHGIHVVSLIMKGLDKNKYCFSLVGYANSERTIRFDNFIRALARVAIESNRLGGAFLHFSIGSNARPDVAEHALIMLIASRMPIVAAAGNDGLELRDDSCTVHPACYTEIKHVIGSVDQSGNKLRSSNYGSRVTAYELGLWVKVQNITMSGTSQAAAIFSNKLLKGIK